MYLEGLFINCGQHKQTMFGKLSCRVRYQLMVVVVVRGNRVCKFNVASRPREHRDEAVYSIIIQTS